MPPPKKRKLDKEGIQSSEKPSHDEDDVSMNVVDEDGQGAMSVESHSQSQSRSGGSEREASEELQGSRNPDPDEDSDSEMNSSTDTDEEIALSKMKKSKKTAKRKIRATSPTQFGSTLEALLGTSAPSAAPLALKSGMHRRMKNDRKDVKAKRELESQRKEHEEVGRVTDVIGGWGGENERALRKVAQRGVVQLFNVITKAQAAKVNEESSKLALRGSGKPTLDAPKIHSKGRDKKKSLIGVSQRTDETVGKDVFMDAIRSGAVVSKY